MDERTSKILLIIEMLILIIPTTLFYLVYGGFMIMWSFDGWQGEEGLITAFTLLSFSIFIFAAWYATIYFMRHGRSRLKYFPNHWKIVAYLAGIFVILSWSYLLVFELGFDLTNSSYTMVPFFGLFGTPLLIPLVHLSLEWKLNT